VVTGAGKTLFAMQCMLRVRSSHPECRFLVVVPTVALLDQWRAALTRDLGVRDNEIATAGGGSRPDEPRRVVIAVANTARRLVPKLATQGDWFLIVDECHRVASPANRQMLVGDFLATLGLSATPERQYDTWFDDFVVPALGPIIYRYTYERARQEGVISAFDLWNVRVPLTAEEKEEIDSASAAISREAARLRAAGLESSDRLQRLLFARSRHSQSARARISATVALVDSWHGRRGIVFHESIEGAELIARALARRGHRVRLYHSGLGSPTRYENLRLYTVGQIDVLVTCRALDEVPHRNNPSIPKGKAIKPKTSPPRTAGTNGTTSPGG
jgi:superfamily II DNA or RNA helicase